MGVARFSLVFVFALVLVFSLGIVFETAEAKKSAGTYLTEIGSKKICGDRMCVEPQSIAEKIEAFFESKRIQEGSVEQQVGRFSEGGVSQQAFEDKSISKYVNGVLGFSIKPYSFNNINDFDENFYLGNIIFTSTKSNYQIFPSYFTLTKSNDPELVMPTGLSFKDNFIKIYSDGLKSNSVISDVKITDSSFSEKSKKYTLKFSGQITNLLGPKTIQTNFAMIVLFSESTIYSFTLNSSPEDFEQDLQDFEKAYDSFKISPDSKKEKEKQKGPKNEKIKNNEEKKEKGN